MTRDVFEERERGIEAQWARKHDEELIQKLRERAKIDEIATLLARKLRVEDPALRQRLLDLGFTHETGPVLFVAPLVQVAWADGKVTARERDTILAMAAVRGIAPGSPVHALLLDWLARPPRDEIYRAALDVIRTGISVLPPSERVQRVTAYAESFRRVAETSVSAIRRVFGKPSVPPGAIALIERMTADLAG